MFSPGIRRELTETLSSPAVKWISCRDNTAFLNNNLLKGGKRAVNTYDPALWCADVYQTKACDQADTVGLGMMFTNSVSEVKAARLWIQIMQKLDKEKIPWKIFVNGSGRDVAYARAVYSALPEAARSFEDCLEAVPETPSELVKTISGFRSLISFRLHSHVIAAALGIPSVGISWDDKLPFFFRKIWHEERCCTVEMRADTIVERLLNAEKEGVDGRLIEEQKRIAEKLLLSALN